MIAHHSNDVQLMSPTSNTTGKKSEQIQKKLTLKNQQQDEWLLQENNTGAHVLNNPLRDPCLSGRVD